MGLEKEANRANNSVVDLKMDDQPVGRLVLNHGQVYDFNLSTADIPKEQVLVDLDIGETPQLVNKSKKSKPAKTKMWVDDGESVHHKKVNKSDAEKLSKLVKAKDVTGTMAQIDSEEAATTATTPAKATPAKAAIPAQPASPNKKS